MKSAYASDPGSDKWVNIQDRMPIDDEVTFTRTQRSIIVIVHGDRMLMPHNHRPPQQAPAVAQGKCVLSQPESAYVVYQTDCMMWNSLSADAKEGGGSAVRFALFCSV